ncbi:MAG: VOC family protein [Rhodospirillales bacterium]
MTFDAPRSQHAFISGIQHIGIGVPDLDQAWHLYRRAFGFDVPVLRDQAEAPNMTRYTGGKVLVRDTVIALNDKGGGGIEVCQIMSRPCERPSFAPALGDLGINAVRLGSESPAQSLDHCRRLGFEVSAPSVAPSGEAIGSVIDPLGLVFQFVETHSWFRNRNFHCGGVSGAMMGVRDINAALDFYQNCLGFRRVIFDDTGHFEDFKSLPGGDGAYRRLLLERDSPPRGPFGRLFGINRLELVQCLDRTPQKIFGNRQWGDQGFIHIGFDVVDLDGVLKNLSEAGYPTTIRSNDDFKIGDAAGSFAYVEDLDGTLVEIIETRRIPILKAIGWYLDLTKRERSSPVADWMLKALALMRVRDRNP